MSPYKSFVYISFALLFILLPVSPPLPDQKLLFGIACTIFIIFLQCHHSQWTETDKRHQNWTFFSSSWVTSRNVSKVPLVSTNRNEYRCLITRQTLHLHHVWQLCLYRRVIYPFDSFLHLSFEQLELNFYHSNTTFVRSRLIQNWPIVCFLGSTLALHRKEAERVASSAAHSF